jgi:hypothetical protein
MGIDGEPILRYPCEQEDVPRSYPITAVWDILLSSSITEPIAQLLLDLCE